MVCAKVFNLSGEINGSDRCGWRLSILRSVRHTVPKNWMIYTQITNNGTLYDESLRIDFSVISFFYTLRSRYFIHFVTLFMMSHSSSWYIFFAVVFVVGVISPSKREEVKERERKKIERLRYSWVWVWNGENHFLDYLYQCDALNTD